MFFFFSLLLRIHPTRFAGWPIGLIVRLAVIGMTSPATVLDVNGDVTARADAGGQAFRAFGRTGDDFAWAPLTFTNTGAAYNGGIAWTPSGATIAVGSGLANVMSWLPSGYVGIGTTNPGQKLEVNGGMTLNTATAKPGCSSTTRGTFWVTQGGAGVKDNVEVCAKDAADAYAWRTLY